MRKHCFFPIALVILAACTSNVPAPVVERGAVRGQADTYVVKSGDTIYSIARELGMEPRELIALNIDSVQNPDQIAVGRVLRIKPASATSEVAVVAPVTSEVVVVLPIGGSPVIERRPETAGNTDKSKREPKAGKEPYSEQALLAARSDGPPKPEPKPNETAAAKPVAPVGGGLTWIWPAGGKLIGTFSENGSKGIDIAGKAGDPVIAAGGGRVVYSGTGLRGYGKLVIIKHDATYLSAYAHNQNILVKEGQSVTQGQRIAEMGSTDADRVKLHFEVRRQGKPVDPLKHLPPR